MATFASFDIAGAAIPGYATAASGGAYLLLNQKLWSWNPNSSRPEPKNYVELEPEVSRNRPQSTGGATVYIEKDGIGHAYIDINGTIYSFGRYDGSYSPSSGRFGPVGRGIMMRYKGREAREFIKDRTNKYPTDIYSINSPNFNADAAYQYLNDLYWSGTPNRTGGRETGIYLLTGNNCATTIRDALEVGGFPVRGSSPAELGSWIRTMLNLQPSLKPIYP